MCQVEPLGRLGGSLCDLTVKNRNFSAQGICCHFFTRECDLVDYFCRWLIDKFLTSTNLFQNFWGYKVFETYRLIQTIMFLTNSVFRMLFAYFDESMASIGGYEP